MHLETTATGQLSLNSPDARCKATKEDLNRHLADLQEQEKGARKVVKGLGQSFTSDTEKQPFASSKPRNQLSEEL